MSDDNDNGQQKMKTFEEFMEMRKCKETERQSGFVLKKHSKKQYQSKTVTVSCVRCCFHHHSSSYIYI